MTTWQSNGWKDLHDRIIENKPLWQSLLEEVRNFVLFD